jgi:hypothetical protein
MKNKGKTNTLKKTKAVLLFLGALPVIVFLFYVATIFLWINDHPFSLPKGGPCDATELDAQIIAVTIADYLAIPEHTTLPTISGESEYLGFTLSDKGGQNIAWVTGDPLSTIKIVVQDTSGKCPMEYMKADPDWDHINSTFTFILE